MGRDALAPLLPLKGESFMSRFIWAIGAIIALFICFLIAEHFAREIHFHTGYPRFLFFVGIPLLVILMIFNAHKAMIFVVIGYIIGFLLGIMFGEYIYYPELNYGRHNWWGIWTQWFLIFIAIGLTWEFAVRVKNRRSQKD